MHWNHKHALSLKLFNKSQLHTIFKLAAHFKRGLDLSAGPTESLLKDMMWVNLFVEPSTRTRVSFEIALKRLGAHVINLAGGESSLLKGETLKDTALTLEALGAEGIVLRHKAAGAAELLSKYIDVPIINAGDGAHEHPTQGLLDTFTLNEQWNGNFENKEVVIVGDILMSRVARSNIIALKTLGAQVTLVGPPAFVPQYFEGLGVTIKRSLIEVLPFADAVMLLRMQTERQGNYAALPLSEYKSLYGLRKQHIQHMKPEALVLHPGPINMGIELDAYWAEVSKQSLILNQVQNGTFIRMALLYLCSCTARNSQFNLQTIS